MPNSDTSVHNVAFDARRQRFEGTVSIGGAADFSVSIPGHPSWGYRRIAKAMVSAGQVRAGVAAKGGSNDRS